MFQKYQVFLVKLSFFFIQVKSLQVLVFDNWQPLKEFSMHKMYPFHAEIRHLNTVKEDVIKICYKFSEPMFAALSRSLLF